LHSMKHPKYGIKNTTFTILNNTLYELQQINQNKPNLWFIGEDKVSSNGSLYFLSLYDPLFLLLPEIILKKVKKNIIINNNIINMNKNINLKKKII
jgi:hypothetical protein